MHQSVSVEGIGRVEVRFTAIGDGPVVLLLYGGGGPGSVSAWADLVARTHGARVLTPTHPGLEGTPRPETLTSVRDMAAVYAALVDALGIAGASVVGHSIGGWIASELGLVAGSKVSSLVLIDAVGIEVPDHPAADVFGGEPRTPSDRVLKMYAGRMMDPTLRSRLAAGKLPPTLVVWGDQDEVVVREYGRAYAQAMAAEFKLLRGVGHSPQMEAPELVADGVWPFIAKHARG